jgi:hypothetical protein
MEVGTDWAVLGSGYSIKDTDMAVATFETPDGEDIEIDSENVVHLRPGPAPETTLIELEDGEEIVVVATELEVAAELELNPLEVIDPEDDDESIEELVEKEDSGEGNDDT